LEKICDQLNKCVCYSDTESIIILRVWQMAWIVWQPQHLHTFR